MRSALIIASFALTLLAAPVPVAEGQALARPDFSDNATPIETTIDKRYSRDGHGGLTESRDIPEQEAEVEKRKQRLHIGRSEEEDSEADVEKRTDRSTKEQPRSEEEDDETDVEKRTDRSAKEQPRSEEGDGEADVEKRGVRLSKGLQNRGVRLSKGLQNRGVRLSKGKQNRGVRLSKGKQNRGVRLGKVGRSEGVKNTIRNIYDGVVGIVEALKTRGFSSAINLPARQPM